MKAILQAIKGSVATLGIPQTTYEHWYEIGGATQAATGHRMEGEAYAHARKVEAIDVGGNFTDPIIGKPSHMQGEVLGVDPQKNELLVEVGYPVHAVLPLEQPAQGFHAGDHVEFEVVGMPRFVLKSAEARPSEGEQQKKPEEDSVEEASEESFPASDPPSWVRQHV